MGEQVIKAIYDSVRNFELGLSIVLLKNKYGVINRSGDLILPLVYSQIKKVNKYMFAVQGKGKWSLYNRNGLQSNNRSFSSIGIFLNGHAIASDKNGFFGLIDTKGNFTIKPKFNSLERAVQW